MRMLSGAYTALVTPFTANDELDEEGFRQNIRFQVENGIDGLVPLGTTGEAPTLTHEEKEQIIKITVQEAKGKVPILVGTGSYSTKNTIEYTQHAEEHGADMALIVTPYYNKPTQEGLYLHFKAAAENTSLPIVIYNIQGRTGQNIETSTLKRLADIPNIIGVKESSGNMGQVSEVIETIARHRPDFGVMSGDDANTLALMALGGHGIISVISNVVPNQVKALVLAMQGEQYALARDLHYNLISFVRSAFLETNPIPIKTVMNFLGMPAGECRLPLCNLTPDNKRKLESTLKNLSQLREKETNIYART